jgi:ankyrin repeat protein
MIWQNHEKNKHKIRPTEEHDDWRKLADGAPNIFHNLPVPAKTRSELYLVACFAVALQAAVLAVAALITYYPKWKLEDNGAPVARYAYPLFAVGTTVLVTGMFLCATVVEQSTKETVYKFRNSPTQPRDAFIMWLQQGADVGDQQFDPYAIFASGLRKSILTSRPIFDGNKPFGWPASTNIFAAVCSRVLLICGVLSFVHKDASNAYVVLFEILSATGSIISTAGFVVQFIGLRGLNWVVSIAQLAATLIMVALRAWVRRGLSDRPHNQKLPPGHEMDWLATRLPKHYEKLWQMQMPVSTKPADEKTSNASWDVFEEENKLWSKACWAWNIVSCKDPEEYNIHEYSASDEMTDTERVVMVRNTLGELSNWPVAASKYAMSVATTIESVMNVLSSDFPEELPDKLTWSMVANTGTGSATAEKHDANSQIRLLLTREDGAWKADATVIEALLSLWLYSIRYKPSKSKPEGDDDSGKSSGEMEEEDEHDWRKEGSVALANQNVKLLGRNVTPLRRDLRWYLGDKVRSVVVVHEATERESTFVDTTSIAGTRVLGSGCMTAISAKKFKSRRSKTENSLRWDEEDDETSAEEPETSLAVFSENELVQVLAQDMFSTFMWAVAKFTNRIEGDVTVHEHNIHTTDGVIAPFRLETLKLQNIAQAFYKSGLGSEEEAYHAIIPQLSKENKLPVPRGLIEYARTIAQDQEHRIRWAEAAEVYIWLFQIGQTFEPNDPFSTRTTAMLFEFYETISSIAVHWKAQFRNSDDIEPMVLLRDKVSKNLESAKKPESGSTVMEMLNKTYRIHARGIHAAKADKINGNAVAEGQSNPESNIVLALQTLMEDIFEEYVHPQDVLEWTPLHYAVMVEREEYVAALLNAVSTPANPNAKDLGGWTPLHYAAHKGLKSVAAVLVNDGAELDSQGRLGIRPLHCAVRGESFDMVRWLLEAGADIDAQDHSRNTSLHLALHYGLEQIAMLLQKSGARRTTRDDYGRTVLSMAAAQGCSKVVEAQLDMGIDRINSRDRQGRTALMLAAFNGYVAVVQRLLDDQQCDVNSQDERGHTALMLAACHGHADVVEKLVSSPSCDVNRLDWYRDTALSMVVKGGRGAMVEQLLLAGARVNVANDDGASPLGCAAVRGRIAVAMMLIAKGADVNGKDDTQRSPLGWAAYGGHSDMVSLLLANNADPNYGTWYQTPVLAAADAGSAASMELLLNAGAEVNKAGGRGRKTALRLALDNRDSAILRLLIAKDAKLDADDKGWSALYCAVDSADDDVVQMLLDRNHGPDADDVNDQRYGFGNTLLCRAAERGRITLVNMLLDNGAEHSVTDLLKRTPLMFAAQNGSKDIVERLIGLGSDVNATDYTQWTALMFAAEKGQKDVVEVLLRQPHINIDWVDIEGRTALLEAVISRSAPVVELLLEKNANVSIKDDKGATAETVAKDKGLHDILKLLQTHRKRRRL